jgi:hypothetical protein
MHDTSRHDCPIGRAALGKDVRLLAAAILAVERIPGELTG